MNSAATMSTDVPRVRPARRPYPCDFEIREAARNAYLGLAHLHYRDAARNGHPATIVKVFGAYAASASPCPRAGRVMARAGRVMARDCVGVLVISMPVLNASWRKRAWPGVFDGLDKRSIAAHVNRHIRTISRVIIDPRFRSLGVATALVSEYLRNPLTTATEALAAMGRFSGFFAAAGMREVAIERSRADADLIGRLRALGVEPWMLADAHGVCALLRRSACASSFHDLESALRRWGAYSRSTRAHARDADLRALLELAATRLGSSPRAFVGGHCPSPSTPGVSP